jgi:hypothetical protein
MSESVGNNPNTREQTDAIETLIRGYIRAIELRETRVSQLAAEQRETNPSPELIKRHQELISEIGSVIEEILDAIALTDSDIHRKLKEQSKLDRAA